MFESLGWLRERLCNLILCGSVILTLLGYRRFDQFERWLWIAGGVVTVAHLFTEERGGWFFNGIQFDNEADHALLQKLYMVAATLAALVLGTTPGVDWRLLGLGVTLTVLARALPKRGWFWNFLYFWFIAVGHSLTLWQTKLRYVR
jgi:hypothetical protein